MSHSLDRGAWLTLTAAALMLAWAVVGTLYFFGLPTDGWIAVDAPPNKQISYIYTRNVAGGTSGLKPDDQVTMVEGYPANQEDLSVLADRWQTGNTLQYTLVRGGSTLTVPVSLVRWTFISAVQFFILKVGGISALLGQIIFLVIAVVAFFKLPGDHAARSLLLIAAVVISASAVINLFLTNLAAHVFYAGQFIRILTISTVYTVLFPPFLLRLSLVFPHPKTIVQKYPFLEYLPFLIGLAVIPIFVFTRGIAGYLWTPATIVITISILIHNTLTMKDALSRAQLFWGLWGLIVSLLLFLLTYLIISGLVSGVTADIFSELSNLSFGVMGSTLAIAILRYRLWDIDLIIRRTLQYGLLTLLLGMVYFGLVILLEQGFRTLTGQESPLAVVISTLAIYGLFNPLRRRLQLAVDQRFYRRKYDAEQAVTTFAAAARSETALNALTGQMVSVVRESVQPEQIWVWMKSRKGEPK